MAMFYKDIWECILIYLDNPRDFRSVALTCKKAARAASEPQMVELKAVEFSQQQLQYNAGRLYKKFYYLPNEQLHGLHETYEWMDDACITITQHFSFGKRIKPIKLERS